jgi:hypothetical protein
MHPNQMDPKTAVCSPNNDRATRNVTRDTGRHEQVILRRLPCLCGLWTMEVVDLGPHR